MTNKSSSGERIFVICWNAQKQSIRCSTLQREDLGKMECWGCDLWKDLDSESGDVLDVCSTFIRGLRQLMQIHLRLHEHSLADRTCRLWPCWLLASSTSILAFPSGHSPMAVFSVQFSLEHAKVTSVLRQSPTKSSQSATLKLVQSSENWVSAASTTCQVPVPSSRRVHIFRDDFAISCILYLEGESLSNAFGRVSSGFFGLLSRSRQSRCWPSSPEIAVRSCPSPLGPRY